MKLLPPKKFEQDRPMCIGRAAIVNCPGVRGLLTEIVYLVEFSSMRVFFYCADTFKDISNVSESKAKLSDVHFQAASSFPKFPGMGETRAS